MLGPTRKLTSFDFRETNLGISSPVTDPVFACKLKLNTKKRIKDIIFIIFTLSPTKEIVKGCGHKGVLLFHKLVIGK